MKKPTPWAEDIEKAIAKAYKQGRDDEHAAIKKQQGEVYELASKIMQRMAAYQLSEPVLTEVPGRGRLAAPKRKPVMANENEIALVLHVLSNVNPPYSPLSPKNVAAVWLGKTGATKTVSVALKALVADGRATVKRGKYALAQTTVDNGLSQTPALSGQS